MTILIVLLLMSICFTDYQKHSLNAEDNKNQRVSQYAVF